MVWHYLDKDSASHPTHSDEVLVAYESFRLGEIVTRYAVCYYSGGKWFKGRKVFSRLVLAWAEIDKL